MKRETDAVTCQGGLRGSITTGNPLAFRIPNAEAKEWSRLLDPWEGTRESPLTRPRPGHADFAGAMKYASHEGDKLHPADIQNVIERASARETAGRVAAGAVCKELLASLEVSLASFVYRIGRADLAERRLLRLLEAKEPDDLPLSHIEKSPLRMTDEKADKHAKAAVDDARKRGVSLGGGFAVIAFGLLPGIGSFSQWDERLEGRIAQALVSIPAVKLVGFGAARWREDADGSAYHDEIVRKGETLTHATNRAGGITGGLTNGMPVVVTGTVKPIPTQREALQTVDLASGKPAKAPKQRSDITAVPAASVIAESMLALVLADAVLAEMGGSHIDDVVARWVERKRRMGGLHAN
jgi:chorismate synthase